MKYSCKVFTPEFKARFDAEVEEEVKAELIKRGVADDRKSSCAEFQRIQARSNFYSMWNNPEVFNNVPIVKEYYESIGLWKPEYTEIVCESAEKGLQSQPRIMWNGKVKKIDEIEEIFSFTRVESECVH